MEAESTCKALYTDDKIIQDHVRFENVLIVYDAGHDIEVEYVADLQVKGSSKDWIGIYESNWKDYESFLAHQSVFGFPSDDSGRRRKIKFKSKWLKDAKPQTHYQFVYINKYLEIMGVSQYFQIKEQEGLSNLISDSSISAKPSSSPIKNCELKQKEELPLEVRKTKGRGSNCRLSSPTRWEDVCTSCHHCQGIFNLKSSCDQLLEKHKEYQERNEFLRERIQHLEKCLEKKTDEEKEEFKRYVWRITQAVYHQEGNKPMANDCVFDWDYTRKELYLKAIAGHQELTIQALSKVICQLRLTEAPCLVSSLPEHFEDTVQFMNAEERHIAEVCNLNNNTSEEEIF